MAVYFLLQRTPVQVACSFYTHLKTDLSLARAELGATSLLGILEGWHIPRNTLNEYYCSAFISTSV